MEKLWSWLSKASSPSFQISSDLHLEVGQQYSSFEIPPSAPFLILAGDIGRLIDYDAYLAFLSKLTTQFEKVFLVLGNHEFYGHSFASGLEMAQKLEEEPVLDGKFVLLHQKRYDVPGSSVSILGCTLWSKIAEDSKGVVQMRVKDFQKIENWHVDNHNSAFEADMSWLRKQVSMISDENSASENRKSRREILVVTHHAPAVQETASPEQVGNAWSSAFATDLVSDGNWPNVKMWVFGHTHYTTQFERSGIRIVSNQRGYVLPGSAEKKSNARDKKKVYDVRRVVHLR